jgi:hypothetical protein
LSVDSIRHPEKFPLDVIVRPMNGDTNGLIDREKYYEFFLAAMLCSGHRQARPTQLTIRALTIPGPLSHLVVMNIRLAATFSALVFPLLVTGPSAALADSQPMRMNSNITEEQVLNAQKSWCNGLRLPIRGRSF